MDYNTCTPYHKFYIQKSYRKDNVDIVETTPQKDMKLIKSEYPIIDQDQDLLYSYTNGFFQVMVLIITILTKNLYNVNSNH